MVPSSHPLEPCSVWCFLASSSLLSCSCSNYQVSSISCLLLYLALACFHIFLALAACFLQLASSLLLYSFFLLPLLFFFHILPHRLLSSALSFVACPCSFLPALFSLAACFPNASRLLLLLLFLLLASSLLASCFLLLPSLLFFQFHILPLAACNVFLPLAAGNFSFDALPLLQAGSADYSIIGDHSSIVGLVLKNCHLCGISKLWFPIFFDARNMPNPINLPKGVNPNQKTWLLVVFNGRKASDPNCFVSPGLALSVLDFAHLDPPLPLRCAARVGVASAVLSCRGGVGALKP